MRELKIAYGDSCKAKKWVNRTIQFDALCERVQTTFTTPETVEEYKGMSREERNRTKDKGGFVGGWLKQGRRLVTMVECRSMLTHDVDGADAGFLDRYWDTNPYTSMLYTTHGHRPEAPRYRIVTPLTRDVTLEEYVAIARFLAAKWGIDCVDQCSYKVNQLMYWPTTPSDGEFVHQRFDGEWLDPDAFLAQYPTWRDISTHPVSSRETSHVQHELKQQQDPLEKDGMIGAFNNAHFPIQTYIETELADVYERSTVDDRYRYIPSDSTAGALVYNDRFLYSHHASDPAYGQLLNAFDLMRIHRFGDSDHKQSMKLALEAATQDDAVQQFLIDQRHVGENNPEDTQWEKQLVMDPRTGQPANMLRNAVLIMQNDPNLKHIVFNQLADGMEINGPVPWKHPARFWRDADDAQLITYVELTYARMGSLAIAVTKVTDDRSYHPIHDYLNSLPPWDGECRVDTLLVDYLGAADTPYTRAVTRKVLCAAIRRVKQPGTKFDYIPVLNGPQGIGKSTLIAKLGGPWFSDSLSLSDTRDKTAAEKLQGYWVLEISELAGMRKSDIDKVKAFISRQDDKYRASFGHRVTPHPRQCVFFGTTNSEKGYLRDVTGNRRFWTVRTPGGGPLKAWDMPDETVAQIWAEAMAYEEFGEPLYLPASMDDTARAEQREALEQDDREGLIREYLDLLLPEDWDKMDLYRRRDFVRDRDDLTRPVGTVQRTAVSNMEIWCECFGKPREDIRPIDSYTIAAMMERIEGWEKTGAFQRQPIYGKQRVYLRR